MAGFARLKIPMENRSSLLRAALRCCAEAEIMEAAPESVPSLPVGMLTFKGLCKETYCA